MVRGFPQHGQMAAIELFAFYLERLAKSDFSIVNLHFPPEANVREHGKSWKPRNGRTPFA